MGCDIHFYIEQNLGGQWESVAKVEIGRNYLLFSCLAGVRNDFNVEFPSPKGIPDDIGIQAELDYYLFVSSIAVNQTSRGDHAQVPSHKALGYIKSGVSKRKGSRLISHPDWHSVSWLTLEELLNAWHYYTSVREQYGYPELFIINGVTDMMAWIEKGTTGQTRVVFWFDS